LKSKKKEKGEKWKMLRTHIPFTLAHDPNDEHFNYQETLHLHLQYEYVRYAITLTELHIRLAWKKSGLARFE